jgi:hypothetical protein
LNFSFRLDFQLLLDWQRGANAITEKFHRNFSIENSIWSSIEFLWNSIGILHRVLWSSIELLWSSIELLWSSIELYGEFL